MPLARPTASSRLKAGVRRPAAPLWAWAWLLLASPATAATLEAIDVAERGGRTEVTLRADGPMTARLDGVAGNVAVRVLVSGITRLAAPAPAGAGAIAALAPELLAGGQVSLLVLGHGPLAVAGTGRDMVAGEKHVLTLSFSGPQPAAAARAPTAAARPQTAAATPQNPGPTLRLAALLPPAPAPALREVRPLPPVPALPPRPETVIAAPPEEVSAVRVLEQAPNQLVASLPPPPDPEPEAAAMKAAPPPMPNADLAPAPEAQSVAPQTDPAPPAAEPDPVPPPAAPPERPISRNYRLADSNELAAAARAGDVAAQIELGTRSVETGADAAGARRWFEQAANGGSAVAAFNLAQMHRMGIGGPVDDGKAFRFYKMAADQDFPVAVYNLALLYLEGRGVKVSARESKRLMEKAAALGYQPAQSFLQSALAGKQVLIPGASGAGPAGAGGGQDVSVPSPYGKPIRVNPPGISPEDPRTRLPGGRASEMPEEAEAPSAPTAPRAPPSPYSYTPPPPPLGRTSN